MNSYLKQSTASQSRAIGPFVSDTDFKTPQTGLTIANTDIKLVINGAASANKNSGGGTHRINGVYGVTFDATDTATVGEIDVSVVVAGALPVNHTFIVVEEAVYDMLFGASAIGYIANQPVDLNTIKTQSVTAAAGVTFPTSIASPTNITAGTITTATNLTNAPTSGDFTATMKTSIGTAVAASAVASVTGGVGGNVTGSIGSLAAQAKLDVNAECDTALADYDGPTNAEMVARTLAAASYATAAAQATAQADLDILTGTDGVTLATSQPNYAPAKVADIPTETENAEAVWDLTLAGHTDPGSTGEALNAAGAAGDPWTTSLPGAYGAGSAGFIIGTNLDALITSRMATYTQPTGFLAATFPSGTIANTTNITAGTMTTVTNLTNAPTSGDFTATMKTSIGTAVAASAVASVTGNVGGNVTGSVGSVLGNVGGTVATVTNLTNAPTSGDLTATMKTSVQTAAAAALTAYDPPTNAEMEARTLVAANYATAANLATVDTVVDAIKAVTDLLPNGGALTSLATAAALATVDSVVDAIKLITDQFVFDAGGGVNSNITYINSAEVGGDGSVGNPWGPA